MLQGLWSIDYDFQWMLNIRLHHVGFIHNDFDTRDWVWSRWNVPGREKILRKSCSVRSVFLMFLLPMHPHSLAIQQYHLVDLKNEKYATCVLKDGSFGVGERCLPLHFYIKTIYFSLPYFITPDLFSSLILILESNSKTLFRSKHK